MRRLDLLRAALHDGGVLDPVAEMVKLGEEKLVAPIRKLREGRREEGEGAGEVGERGTAGHGVPLGILLSLQRVRGQRGMARSTVEKRREGRMTGGSHCQGFDLFSFVFFLN